jgi:aspartyl-tRNA(Asn)/glutamyl-tRNA(Gln) amidotransferase subunit A
VSGLLTTTVADAARHLDITSGPHERDRTSLPRPTVGYEEALEALDVTGLRARWSLDLGFAVVDPEVAAITSSAAKRLAEAAGLVLDEDPVTLTDPVRTWLSAGALDLWVHLERGMWPDVADDLTLYVRRSLEATEGHNPARLAASQHRRLQLQIDCAAIFEEVDVLITPTTAVPAFAAEGPPPGEVAGQQVGQAMATPFTMLANLCWNPAISVPAGITNGGLPVGLQIMTRRHADELPLRLARIWEQTQPWPRLAPR